MIKDACVRNGTAEITIGTAEIFQGQERPIIIVSTVRTNEELGFVKDQRVYYSIVFEKYVIHNFYFYFSDLT